jgi:hypothetical protein
MSGLRLSLCSGGLGTLLDDLPTNISLSGLITKNFAQPLVSLERIAVEAKFLTPNPMYEKAPTRRHWHRVFREPLCQR